MSGSKVHSLPITSYDGRAPREELPEEVRDAGDQLRHPPRRGSNSRAIHDASDGSDVLDAEELAMPGAGQVHAPFPGQLEACEGCGRPSMIGMESGPQVCEQCNHQAVLEGKCKDKCGVRASSRTADVAVTSSREIALRQEHLAALRMTGSMMLGMSALLLLLLLVAWQGIDFSLVTSLSPWLGIYLPIPLGLLNGFWSLHCGRRGYIKYQGSGSCMTWAGFCGTAWGCSGPSCALNLGLDLGLLITALLAALPAGASGRGCGYHCYILLCFPCAPVGGDGMAAGMVLATLGLAFGVGLKMWGMATALKKGLTGEEFLPW